MMILLALRNLSLLSMMPESFVVDDAGELYLAEFRMKTALHGCTQGVGLLVYLLEHEMGETAFLYLAQIELQFLYDGSDLHLTQVCDTDAAAPLHHRYLLVIQIDDPVGVLHDRCGVRTDEELFLA